MTLQPASVAFKQLPNSRPLTGDRAGDQAPRAGDHAPSRRPDRAPRRDPGDDYWFITFRRPPRTANAAQFSPVSSRYRHEIRGHTAFTLSNGLINVACVDGRSSRMLRC